MGRGDDMAYKIHPAAMALPEMTDDEYRQLLEGIGLRGQLEPIKLLDGKIIDGRHRYRACNELGKDPKVIDVDLCGLNPAEYVWELNGDRRNLTPSQRACVAVDLLPELEKEAKKRHREKSAEGGKSKGKEKTPTPSTTKHQARDDAAKLTGTNPRYVSDAKAVKQADPELFEEVKQGKKKLTEAKQEVKRKAKRDAHEEKLTEVREKEQPSDWRIIHGDCVTELPAITGARLVFADPPYNIGVDYGKGAKSDSLPADVYLAWCRQWITKAIDCLTKDGSIWVMVPDECAAEVAMILKSHDLHRRAWIKWYETFGVNCTKNFNRTSRHIFYCVLDPKHYVFNEDAVTRPSDRQTKYKDKRAVAGGKLWDDVWTISRLAGTCTERLPDFPTQLPLELVTAIVGCASEPGDLVVDPFCGSATTGVAAKQLGRKFVGIEKEEKFWERATVRLASG